MQKYRNKSDYDPRVFQGIAHRGLWDLEKSENGMKAFENAIEHNLAFELDVHLSKDGALVVSHDSNLLRMTGKDGNIPDLALRDIKTEYRLHDGSEIPTLEEVLFLNKERVPIIVELKVDNGNYVALANRVLETLKNIKDKKTISLISFDPRALNRCKDKGFSRGLLITKTHTYILGVRRFFDYLDVEDCLADEKRVLSFSEKAPINVWTIDTPEKLQMVKGKFDMCTFQYPLTVEDIRGNERDWQND